MEEAAALPAKERRRKAERMLFIESFECAFFLEAMLGKMSKVKRVQLQTTERLRGKKMLRSVWNFGNSLRGLHRIFYTECNTNVRSKILSASNDPRLHCPQ